MRPFKFISLSVHSFTWSINNYSGSVLCHQGRAKATEAKAPPGPQEAAILRGPGLPDWPGRMCFGCRPRWGTNENYLKGEKMRESQREAIVASVDQ